ncbi:MAG: DUF4266 domain-containing protein [Rhizobacter sp.]
MNRLPVVLGRFLVVLTGAVLAAGCSSSIQPWVKPYERERLAAPVMQFSRDGLSAKHFEHVREVREGGRGATGVQGGGCGCN